MEAPTPRGKATRERGELNAPKIALALLSSECGVCAGPHQPSDRLVADQDRRAWARELGPTWAALLERSGGDLPTTRGLLRRFLDAPRAAPAARGFERLLRSGRLRLRLGRQSRIIAEPMGTPSWVAAWGVATMLSSHPGRLRRCAHPACGCYFLDTSRSGRRKWCAMALCGNRVKAQRHYRRAER
ncbi:MAG: CGNR zinc finger domain-containing protein [Thermoplasmata archaeon]|nr:CGNR zinc finger domain-containing protein [Thermoplasmata archaeon]